MKISKVQDYPTIDSIQTEPFESLVETYYQLKGYITSSNKWFWYWKKGNKQRGYQDIDLIAINENQTLIIGITTNLDDKIRCNRKGEVKKDMLEKLSQYFNRAESYLKMCPEYAWLVKDYRNIEKILVYAHGRNAHLDKIVSELDKLKIKLLSGKEIIENLEEIVKELQKKGLKTNNQLIKLIELWSKYKN